MLRFITFLKSSLCILLCICTLPNLAQNPPESIEAIHKLIESDSLQQAESLLFSKLQNLKTSKNYPEIAHCIFPLGKIHILHNQFEKAKTESKNLLQFIENHSRETTTLYLANLEFSKVCLDLGLLPEAYQHAEKAKTYALQQNNNSQILNSEYYLADYSMKLGQIEAFENHIRKAHWLIKKHPNISYKISAKVYNLMGALMYFSSKQDSALHYFEKALKHVSNLDQTPENQLYLPAAIRGNMSLIKLNQGKPSEAQLLINASIQLCETFLKNTKNHALTNRVKRNLMIAYSNLNGLHFDLGDFEKSEQITSLSYNYAKQHFPEHSQEYFMAAISVAEVQIQKRDFTKALHFLGIAEKSLAKISGDNFQLKAFLYSEYANVHFKNNKIEDAIKYWELASNNYSKSNPNAYDPNKLYCNMNLAIAYSKTGQKQKATTLAEDTYDYFRKRKGEQDYFTNALMLTFAQVYYNLKMYNESLLWSNKSLNIYNENLKNNTTDKIYFEENKSEIYIINAQSRYYASKEKDSVFLKSLLPSINQSITSLEERKQRISSYEDLSTLIENHKTVFNFAKKINLELYKKTNNPTYLEKTIGLHESALYNRIRARLNLKSKISFSNIPEQVTQRENQLKKQLALPNQSIKAITTVNQAWNTFLDSLKQNHPKYYKMRYASIEEPLGNLKQNIPNNTTVLRYFYIEQNLFALVLSQSSKKLFQLNDTDVAENIFNLTENQMDFEKTSLKLHQLYNMLWKPLEASINTEKVIIIPDAKLFNLSFESLMSKPTTSLNDIANYSLLKKHIISYNYSLLLLNKNKKTVDYQNDFVAFAPEFNEKMKTQYSLGITDSISVDKTYLTLLPQPFSVDLAKQYSRMFNGASFINEKASKQIFKNQASEHKIIHIGTHAESNNITPELSRLIFAKNSTNEDNSLYTYEIYNENLNSNLAILTACETGKPTYQAGEGMISLAHAFNYAGSESILTSLWKIDEKSSAEIIGLFFKNIKRGMDKDKALQQSKLSYLKSSKGRIRGPQYWAGLVLIGDNSPILLNENTQTSWYVLGAIILIILIFILIKTSWFSQNKA